MTEVVYEVNLDVEAAIAPAFRVWLGQHVREMLALPGFVSAEILHDEPAPDTEPRSWSVRYRLCDRLALQHYFEQHAAQMRADGLQRFGQRFTASRRILLSEPLTAPPPTG